MQICTEDQQQHKQLQKQWNNVSLLAALQQINANFRIFYF